jgi:hypothetical protein
MTKGQITCACGAVFEIESKRAKTVEKFLGEFDTQHTVCRIAHARAKQAGLVK